MKKSVDLAVGFVALLAVSAAVSAQAEAYDRVLGEAEALVVEGNYRNAIKAFNKAQKLAGEPTFECCRGLANAFNQTGAYKDGVASARKALPLARNPVEEVQIYNLLGIGLYSGGSARKAQLEEAVSAFGKILEIAESLPANRRGGINLARYSLGLSLLKLERDEEGVAVLKEFLAASPTGPEARTARSYVDNPMRARVPMMPELEVVTLDGSLLTSGDLLGKVVVLDFWGTWCPPCVASIPHLKKLAHRSEKRPLVVVSVSNDGDGDMLRGFVAEHGMSWPQVWDKDHRLVREVFQIAGYPTFIVVDHKGEIVFRDSGWGPEIESQLDSWVARALRAAKKAGKS